MSTGRTPSLVAALEHERLVRRVAELEHFANDLFDAADDSSRWHGAGGREEFFRRGAALGLWGDFGDEVQP